MENDDLCIGNDYIYENIDPDRWNRLVATQRLQYNDEYQGVVTYLGSFGHDDVLVSWVYAAADQKLTATIQGSGAPGCDFVIAQIASAVAATQ